MERFDVVVVGAGPAGSTAAWRLADAGANVLLIDKTRFPRDKPCGGGLTGRALRVLPFPVDPVVEHRVDRVTFGFGHQKTFGRSSRGDLCLMTQRRRLDEFLAQAAAARGVDFRDGVRVSELQIEADGVSLRIDGSCVSGKALIGADGVNGTCGRTLGLAGDLGHGVALEGNASHRLVDPERYRGRIVLELGTVPGGYGWVFPKGDHVNFGVGGWATEGPHLRAHLRRLCRAHGVDAGDLTEVRGYRLPFRTQRTRIVAGPALLVGDAAGLVDPISGDGIYEALVSSKLAATAIGDLLAGRVDDLDSFEPEVARALGPLNAAGWGAKAALDRFPRLTFAVLRLPLTWRAVEKVVAGDVRDPALTRGGERAALGLIAALARRAGDSGEPFRGASSASVGAV